MSVIYNMPDADYRAAKGVSQTTLKTLVNKTPAHYLAETQSPRQDTAAFRVGRHLHNFVLLGESDIVVRPEDIDGRTKEGKSWLAANEGKSIITADEGQKVRGMVDAIARHPDAAAILKQGCPEVSVFATLQRVECKGRFDWLPAQGNAIVDIKTCEDASPRGFAQSYTSYDYHIQAAFYLDLAQSAGLDRTEFVFIAVEKTPPHAVAIYQADADSVDLGRRAYEKALRTLELCRSMDDWPAYPTGIQFVNVMPWKYKEQADA